MADGELTTGGVKPVVASATGAVRAHGRSKSTWKSSSATSLVKTGT